MRQLVDLIEGLNVDGVSSSPAALRADQTADDANEIRQLETFVTVSSDFYQSLEAWYSYEAERWAEDQLSELSRKRNLKNHQSS
jgi:hypothetical protein